jgi:uncharacterized membrane protein
MAKIYYVGDWAVMTGPVFAETPFFHSAKGLDIFNYGIWLKEALESTGRHVVNSVPSWDFYNRLGPGDYEAILEEYDVLIFSDVDAKLFQLAPNFFDRAKFGKKPLTFPDRLRLTLEAVKAGKGLMLLGGWYSFTGEMGKGGWGRTLLKELLPVLCLDYEDLVETTEGFSVKVTEAGKKIFKKFPFPSMPPLLGYNKTIPKKEGRILLKVKETGDPLLAVRDFGQGRVLAYTSDPAPHWGCNFVYWEEYNHFWLECLDYVLAKK